MSARPSRDALITRLQQQVQLFQDFSRQDVEAFLHHARKREMAAGERVLVEGEAGRAMYLIVQGTVEVSSGADLGNPCLLAQLGPGDTFGELCLLDPDWPRSAQVRALTPLVLLEFDRGDLVNIPAVLPKLYRNMAYLIASRLRSVNHMVSLILHTERPSSFGWAPEDREEESSPGTPEPVRSAGRVVRRDRG